MLFKYTPKDKRKDDQKALPPVREIVNSLVTSYAFSLRRIDQSVPKENLVIRTSLRNKRVVLRENLSNPLTGASSSSGSPPGGPSSSKRSNKNKGGLAKENQKLNISLESGVLKASFQDNTLENLQISHDGGILKAYTTNDMVFTPQEQEMFSQNEQVQPRISVF